MTSRQRVCESLKHRQPDLIPIDFGSTRSSGVNALLYSDLMEYLGHDADNVAFDMKQQLSEPDLTMIDRMHGDVVQLHRMRPSMNYSIAKYKKGVLSDGRPCLQSYEYDPVLMEDGSYGVFEKGILIFKRPVNGLYFDEMHHPLENVETESEIDELLTLPALDDEEWQYLRNRSYELYTKTDKAIIASASISLFERGIKDFGYQNFLMLMMTEEELVEYYLSKMTDAYIALLDRMLDACGDYIQIIQAHDDMGTQVSCIFSPELYRRLFKPYHTKIFNFIKQKKKDVFIFFHCCGSIYKMIPELIETGIDILNPIQINAADMDPERLKREFGKDISFWGGGCDVQTTLTFGTIQDIEREVEKMMSIFSKDGGFVFAPTHNLQANIEPQKIIALFDAAAKFRENQL